MACSLGQVERGGSHPEQGRPVPANNPEPNHHDKVRTIDSLQQTRIATRGRGEKVTGDLPYGSSHNLEEMQGPQTYTKTHTFDLM